MEMELKILTPAERKYTYAQSSQIPGQCGLIGHLRGDMDTNGKGFFTTWEDYRKDLKTEAFKAEFDEVINTLRTDAAYGNILTDRAKLASYCYAHPDSAFENQCGREFGVRVNTKDYAYLFRLNPNRGEYNLYCYPYKREWLDRHLEKAEHGIRFIDSHYHDLFRVPDGGNITITRSDGSKTIMNCRYINETHFEQGGGCFDNIWHICQFAERMEQNGNTYEAGEPMQPKKSKQKSRGQER